MSDVVKTQQVSPDVVVKEDTDIQLVRSSSPPTTVTTETKNQTIVNSTQRTMDIIKSGQVILREGGSGVCSQIFVTDLTNSGTGIVADKVYLEDTVPTDSVLSQALTDDDTVTIHFIAEGGVFYSPTVFVDEIECTNLQEYSSDLRLFYGSVDVVVTETRTVLLRSSAGSTTSVLINRAEAAPDITSCLIGSYPEGQSAVKAGDSVTISGTVEETATHIKITGGDAFNTTDWLAVSGGTFTIQGTVTGNSGSLNTKVVAKNNIGSVGSEYTSDNTILLDQAVPTFSVIGTTFPSGQLAFKQNEVGVQSVSVSNFDSITYSSPNGDFDISSPNTYEQDKQIQCTNPLHYNDSQTNYTATAGRSINGSISTISLVVEVADTAPTVSVTQPQARLQSSPGGEEYTITASSDQNLLAAPSLTIPVSGSWVSGFVGSGKNYNATISIIDGDVAGTAAWAFATASTNRAGIQANITGNQVVGGFVSRTLSLDAFATEVASTFMVADTSKLSLLWSFKENMEFYPIGTSPPVTFGWTINSTGITPTKIKILDTSAAASSSQASSITIWESV